MAARTFPRRPRPFLGVAAAAALAWSNAGASALAQRVDARAARPQAPAASPQEQALLQALATDPVTAPYAFQTRRDRARIILSGRVGTRAVHDQAVRLGLAIGVPFVDELVIDTAAQPLPAMPQPVLVPTTAVVPAALSGFPSAAASTSYPYPYPLFGPPIDPFLGYEPPLITYPPWWPALSAQRSTEVGAGGLPSGPVRAAALPSGDLAAGTVEMTVDALGYARLRGKVPSEEARAGLVAKVGTMEGVAGVIDRLEVDPNAPDPELTAPPPGPPEPVVIDPDVPPGNDDTPPPPPVPFDRAMRPGPAAPARPTPPPPVPQPPAPEPAANEPVQRALDAVPELRDSAVRALVADGRVTLRGSVPSAYEAMLAYQAARRCAGVTDIVDALDFPPPQPDRPNPLAERGRPEDVGPYLEAQLRKHLEGQVRSVRVTLDGDVATVTISAPENQDRRRIAAILRTIPVLRGFTVEVRYLNS